MAQRRRSLRISGLSALRAVRTYRETSVVVIATMAVALAAVLPVTTLFHVSAGGLQPSLALVAVPGGDLGLPWSTPVRPPAATRQQGVDTLAAMLLELTAAMVVVAAVTILALSMARESERSGAIAVQRAVGAGRRSLLGSALLEGVMLVVGGLVLGGTAGFAVARTAAARWPGLVQPGTLTASATAILALAAAVMVGTILPVVFPRRRITESETHRRLPVAPIAFQLGVSLIALTTSALVARHAATLTAPSATRSSDGIVFPIALPHTAPADRAARYAELLRELQARGFDSVSLTSPGTRLGLGPVSFVTTDCGRCSESGIWLPWRVKPATYQFVSADTFRLLDVRLAAGRGITAGDGPGAPRVAVVSRSLALREFEDGKAIGRRIKTGDDGADWSTVVGVVEDPSAVGLGGALQPRYTVYLSVLQHPPGSAELLVRAPHDGNLSGNVQPALEAALRRHGPAPAWQSESSLLVAETAPLLWFGRAFAIQGWTMLGIAVVGAFALMSLWVRSLLGELGVRRAVGARRRDLFGFVLARAAGVSVAGVATGLWFGWPVWNELPRVVPGLGPWSPAIVSQAACVLVGAALAGALVPAWRVARMAPSVMIASRSA
jgi:putative ABC transport system permease protein